MPEPDSKILNFKRESLTEIQRELADESTTTAYGVVPIVVHSSGHASLRLSGFDGPHDRFMLAGLLDWIKQDVLADLI